MLNSLKKCNDFSNVRRSLYNDKYDIYYTTNHDNKTRGIQVKKLGMCLSMNKQFSIYDVRSTIFRLNVSLKSNV